LPAALGNHGQLVFLFQNLIGNAVKFRAPDRPVRVEVGARRARARDGWLFWVRDNGIGIEQKYFDKLFVLGERVHAEPSKSPGTGCGLHICKKIVTWHGGRIWVTSRPNQGTTFYFTLPAVPAAP